MAGTKLFRALIQMWRALLDMSTLRMSLEVRASRRMSPGPAWPRIWWSKIRTTSRRNLEGGADLEKHVHGYVHHHLQLARIALEVTFGLSLYLIRLGIR